jgi:RimJ/RimL family protein N-acetyltransferase
MVLAQYKKVEPNPYLTKTVRTERFDVINCNADEALNLTLPWANDPETLHNLMYDKASYSRTDWAKKNGKPNGRNLFFHAIISRETGETVGAHRVYLDGSGTAAMAIVLTAKSWWGKGVFEEVRTSMMDHFSQSPHVIRFFGRVITRNASSVYNYKKIGFRLIGYDLKSWWSPVTGEYVDTLFFEYLAEDWRAKRQLEVRNVFR